MEKFDLIVIGAGPAGIAATLYACRLKINALTISKDIGGLTNFIPDIESYPGYHYLSGWELVKKFQDHLHDFKPKMNLEESVKKIEKDKDGFLVKTEKSEYLAKSVIIATGRWFRKLQVKGAEKLENKGVSYCAACDAPLFKGKTVAVVGGGKSGQLSAIYMEKMMKKIYIFEQGKEMHGIPLWKDAVRKAKNIEIYTGAETEEILGKDKVSGIKVKINGKEKKFDVDAVFIEIGYTPHTDFAKNILKLNERGEIVVDKENWTNVKGIFAAGDCTDINEKQIVVASGEGAKAVMAATEYLAEIQKKN